MLMAPIDYCRPDSLAEAVRVLGEEPSARPLAGGQSLLALLKLRAAQLDLLVDISRLPELQFIDVREDGSVEIGAGVTYAELARSPDLKRVQPKLCEVASGTVDVQVRNQGTFGGNICHNDPINDFPPYVAAVGATLNLVGPEGERRATPEEFFLGAFWSDLRSGEILRSIELPPLGGARVGYEEVEINEAAVRAVATVRVEGDRIADATVVLGCLSVPTRRPAVEDDLRGAPATEEAVSSATAGVAEGVEFPSDADASAAYRAEIAPVVARRAVLQAINGGE
ncbi:xanthine dehydrogenase family protein subunit M [Egibacter rhizosphaerae]|uniref:Xanthine dehydrogenase family protein subunit M n=1 Tax=Egibacter rhizosphaerae TaxID=1670831 RepID=A0A411YGW3_9ACTN|nr:xanthine dehydrogenase family protein subunit M [Egibacter rhizosphaerae]QBI20381.1 xanthine dehydrogenase family protein subunit M [Egibacter rhizosphaerae]